MPSEVNQLFTECNEDFSSGNEETGDFDDDWKEINENTTVKKSSPWVYHTAYELKGLPHAGRYKTYGGGGYVKDLIGTPKHAKGKNHWWIHGGRHQQPPNHPPTQISFGA